MLDQKMCGSDLSAVPAPICVGSDFRCRVMLGHVGLELLGVGALRGLPSRRLFLFVKVVWEIL